MKFDETRCLAYIDNTEVDLRNKRHLGLSPLLAGINKQIRGRCIPDGELFVMNDGEPDFAEVQRRNMMGNQFKIQLASKKLPATFVAFDILYNLGKDISLLLLMDRNENWQK